MKKTLLFVFFMVNAASAQLGWAPLTNIAANTNGSRFDDVFFINENVGWAANGANASVSKTTNGGATWTLQMSNVTMGTNYYFRNIEFIDENIGFVGTLNGVFFKTIDGGTTWNPVTNFPINPEAICGLDAVGTSTIYGCGAYFSPAYIIKSTDSGATWDYIDMSSYANALVEILFLDENNGYASGNNDNGAVILKTTDGGASWMTIFNDTVAGEYVWKLEVLPSNHNVIFGSIESVSPLLGKLIRSTDGGDNWISRTFPDTDVQAVGFLTENHGWMGGHHTGFYETTDGGATWTNTGIGSNLNRIQFLSDNLAYASGSTIYKFSDASLGTPNFQEQERVPLNVRVSPNPIKDKLNIEVDFLGNDHLVIELYSETGQLISQLKRDAIDGAGTKNYSFPFPYAKGVYLVNFHTNTGRQSVKVIK
jgi:photosystem II stability/assembly factor-like uncharacterized protein